MTECPAGRESAYALIAEAYSRLTTEPSDPRDVLEELCHDDYSANGCARVLLATRDGNVVRSPLAAFRVILGSQHGHAANRPPLEFMNLVEPVGGWLRLIEEGFAPTRSVEGGRLALSTELQSPEARESGLRDAVLRRIIARSIAIAGEQGCDQVWAVMHVASHAALKNAGILMQRRIPIQFRQSEHGPLFAKYGKYWQPGQVHLYELDRELACE